MAGKFVLCGKWERAHVNSISCHFGTINHKLTCQLNLSLTWVIFVDIDPRE